MVIVINWFCFAWLMRRTEPAHGLTSVRFMKLKKKKKKSSFLKTNREKNNASGFWFQKSGETIPKDKKEEKNSQ